MAPAKVRDAKSTSTNVKVLPVRMEGTVLITSITLPVHVYLVIPVSSRSILTNKVKQISVLQLLTLVIYLSNVVHLPSYHQDIGMNDNNFSK